MFRFLIILILITGLYAKNVLILNSYSIKLPWTQNELEGILKNLRNRNDLKIYIEFMDTKVFPPTNQRLNDFYKYLKSKYSNMNFDIVITTDDNALNFVRKKYNQALFKNSKIFFAGVNNLSLAKTLDKNIYAGVFEKKEPLANLKFIKKIVPNIKYLYVVADNSNSGNSVIGEYQKAYETIKNIHFIYINKKNLEDVINEIKNYPSNSAMMLLTPFSFNLQGEHINYKYAIMIISEYFKRPIIIHTDLLASLSKSNIVGGKVTDGITQGLEVSKKVLKYLDGVPMNKLGFTFEKANKMYLNVKNLEKFGINAYSLGYKNAIYVNKPDTFFEKYKNWIITTFIIIILILFLLILLLLKNIQLKKYNKKIKDVNKDLENKISDAIDEILQKEILLQNKKEKVYIDIINKIIFELKYPIKKLYENGEDKQIINYLNEKINEIERFFVIEEKKNVSIKETIQSIIHILEKFYGDNIKINVIGNDFYIMANEAQFEAVLLKIIKDLIGNNFYKISIDIYLDEKEKNIIIKANEGTLNFNNLKNINIASLKKDEDKIGIVLSKFILENNLNAVVNIKNYKNEDFLELKFI